MCSAKQRFDEGFEMLKTEFGDRYRIVSERVAASRYGAANRAGAVSSCGEVKGSGGAGITLKVALNSKPMLEVNDAAASTTV